MTISNSNSTTNYTAYDALGDLLSGSQQTGSSTFGFTYTYDLASELVSETNQHGRTLTTTYDRVGRPSTLAGSLSGTNTTYISQTAYGLFGLPYYYERGNNVWHFQAYNNRMQPTETDETINNTAGALLFISCPNWGVSPNWGAYNQCPTASAANDNGTLQSYKEFQGGSGYSSFLTFNQTFNYDGLNRLTSASDTGGWSRTFNYDQWGNSWVTNVTGPLAGNTPTSNVFNSKNQDTRTGYNYDAAGNLLYLNGNTPTYDAENRMTSLVATGGGSESILYDAMGRRVQKSYGGNTTVYVYDNFGTLSSEYVNGAWSRDYIADGSGRLIATENSSGLCTTCYFGMDHLGSVRIVMDQNANVVARHDYLPFGEELLLGAAGRTTQGFNVTSDVTQKFTGQIRDQESGEDFFNARYFTAPLGRFNSPDPMNAGASLLSSQSWNGYGYVLGNPMNSTDPSGTDTCSNGSYADVCVTASGPDPISTWNYSWIYHNWGPTTQSNGGGGGGTSNPPAKPNPAPPANTGARPDWLNNITSIFGYDQRIKLPSCAALAIRTAADDLNPFLPSAADAAQGALSVGQAMKFNQALTYAAAKGLRYPNKSSVFRNILNTSSTLGKLADALPLANLDYELFDGLIEEVRAMNRGECQ